MERHFTQRSSFCLGDAACASPWARRIFPWNMLFFACCVWHSCPALFSLRWYRCWCVTQLVPKHAPFPPTACSTWAAVLCNGRSSRTASVNVVTMCQKFFSPENVPKNQLHNILNMGSWCAVCFSKAIIYLYIHSKDVTKKHSGI